MTTSDNNRDENERLKQLVTERSEEAKMVRKIVAVILTLVTIAIIVGGITGYSYIKSGLEPVNPEDSATVSVDIPLGSSSSQIASILEEKGIINNAMIFRFYIKFSNAADFQAGKYDLSPSMTLADITAALQTGKIIKEPVLTVTIPEGKTMEQIASLYAEKANVDKDEFIEVVEDPDYVKQLINTYPTILSEEILADDIKTPLEGYLFAATYQFYETNPSIDTIVNAMLQKTEDVVTNYLDLINQKEDWTVHDIITMASLVENEAQTEEDRKRIAGVFYNRLAADMRLQTDPTVLYALGERKDRVLYEYLEVDSPYNTYKVSGLPVGPISNFNENSLLAVLEPEKTDYMYFIAADDGKIYYAKTYEEHQQLVAEYLER
ncbi:endolytic transglycosylase MltG [Aquibacillus salsiterrae]|uniref:Endolytic murein transglycosylase n=1 Tax=Aquibacillus salsiterrae TaxID=2950439 RepID=A0A9X3WC60_9BACI|nr:endolytic transglycosylase MltG [Aquibacillus salsiterrae]MDC3415611.1 endolytic transglycosylase MltG [Aquibacillus salsiterrae]